MSRDNWTMTICLLGVILSLLLVGVISETLLRHVIQVIPAIIVLMIVATRATWASGAALPLFIFWFVIVLLIWLFLLGISGIASGHYTTAEILLTVVIGACCVRGAVESLRTRRNSSRTLFLVLVALFAALQVGAMWLSFRSSLAYD
jgi:hypothetical protein